jgi:hypothetical protein
MSRLIFLAAVVLPLVQGQTVETKDVSRILTLKHINATNTQAVCNTFGKSVRCSYDDRLKIVGLAGPKDVVDAVQDAIQKLDVGPEQPRNVELTFFVLVGLTSGPGGQIPEDLAGVAKQLKTVFSFQSFKVMESMVIRAREGRGGEASGLMPPLPGMPAEALKPVYQLRFQNVQITGAPESRSVRVDNLRFGGKIPFVTGPGEPGKQTYQYIDTGINTDVDMKEGQKIVVGKAGMSSANDSMFLVVSAKVIE